MNNNIFQRANIPLPDEILSAREAGDWALAQDILSGWLERDLPTCLRERLELEQYYLSQMRGQYPQTGPALVAEKQQRIPDLTPDDLQQLLVTGWLDTRMVDGQAYHEERGLAAQGQPGRRARAGQPLLPPSEVVIPYAHQAAGVAMHLHLRCASRCRLAWRNLPRNHRCPRMQQR